MSQTESSTEEEKKKRKLKQSGIQKKEFKGE